MVYFKVLLNDKRQKSDNVYPVVVRVTYNRNNTTFNTGIRLDRKYWDETNSKVKHSNANALELNQSITTFYNKIQKAALKLIDDQKFSFETLKERLLAQPQSTYQAKEIISFKKFTEKIIADMLAINKAGNAIIYRTAKNRLLEYLGNDNLLFSQIDYTLLEGFKNKLIKDEVKQNTISNYFRTLRAIYNKAIKQKIVDRTNYPFLDITIKTERTAKRAISKGDIQKLYKTDYEINAAKWHARNYFLLSFCLRGISFTDLAYLSKENLIGDRIIYKRRKTGSQLNIQLLPLAKEILILYSDSSRKYLLPVIPDNIVENGMEAKSIILQWIKTTNKWLRRIAEDCSIQADITTYVTRHSWATIAKSLGYSNELIAEGLGHEYGNKITNIYLDSFDKSVIDAANKKIIKLIGQ